jgi:uncharacterized protein YggE
MNALRITALVASVFCLAILVTPAVASGPVMSPALAPSSDSPGITAMGIGLAQPSAADPFATAQTLYIGIQLSADASSMQKAADDIIARLDAIKAALVKVGVPADGIRMNGLNVNPNYGPVKPGAMEGSQPQPQVTSLNLNGNLTADVPTIRLLLAAMNAATANGATTVNSNAGKGGSPYGTTQPSAADLAKATQAAIANARVSAEALAAASGKKLGAIRSVSSSQPPMMGCCPPNMGWTVQVTVTFDIAQ